MRTHWRVVTIVVLLATLGVCQSAAGASKKKGNLLYMTLSAGYKHATVAPSRDIVKQIGEKAAAFDTTVTEDPGAFTAS